MSMIKAKQVNKAINWIAGAAAVYFAGITVAGYIKRKREAKGTQGVGDVSVWNKGHIRNWIAYEHYGYPEKIVVNISNRPYYITDGHLEVYSYADRNARYWAYNRTFSIREKDLDYIRELCNRYNVEYKEL